MKLTPPTFSDRARSSRLILLAGALLIAAVMAAYHNTFSVPFFFDDTTAIEENQTLRHWWRLAEVLSPPRDGSTVTGRPLINLSFALNYALGGTAPAGYHALNLALHAAAALALFGLIRRTLLRPSLRARFAESATPFAFVAALCWALHPLQTESVTCVAQRTEVLVGLFYLLTLYCFARSVDHDRPGPWAALAVTASFLGMASKEVMVSAPLMVLCYDRTFVAGSWREIWLRRRAFYLWLAASWLLLAALVSGAGGSRGAAAGFGLGVTWWSYLLKQCEAIVLYLRLSVWPHPLVLDYGTAVVLRPIEVLPQALLLVTLFSLTLVALWKRPWLGFLGLWFFAILAPSSSVVPLVSQTMAEHRMYLPLAALTTLFTLGCHAAFAPRGLVIPLVIALALGAVSFRRNQDYRSEISIWSVTIAQRPENARAYSNLGNVYKTLGRAPEAARHYTEALRRDPNQAEAWNNLGVLHLDAGRIADAIAACEAALRLKPDFADALNNLGSALSRSGHPQDALNLFARAVTLKPTLAPAHSNLAGALLQVGRIDEAVAHATTALQLKPGYVDAQVNLGTALLHAGRPADAIPLYEAALRVRTDDAQTRLNLGSAHYRLGRPQDAIPHYEAALHLNPQDTTAHNNLASALFQVGRRAEAVVHYQAALKLAPDNVEARSNLALVLAQIGRVAEAIAEYEDVLRRRPDDAPARESLSRLRAAPGPTSTPRP